MCWVNEELREVSYNPHFCIYVYTKRFIGKIRSIYETHLSTKKSTVYTKQNNEVYKQKWHQFFYIFISSI